jgi:hypothetical protein
MAEAAAAPVSVNMVRLNMKRSLLLMGSRK